MDALICISGFLLSLFTGVLLVLWVSRETIKRWLDWEYDK